MTIYENKRTDTFPQNDKLLYFEVWLFILCSAIASIASWKLYKIDLYSHGGCVRNVIVDRNCSNSLRSKTI